MSAPTKKPSSTGLYVVRLFDGFDHKWMDISEPVPWEEALAVWKKKTDGGTENTGYNDINYYDIFPSDTKMVFSSDSSTPEPPKKKAEPEGPLDDEALGVFAEHLSDLACRKMVFDPDAAGTEVYDERRGRYQFKVQGGRGSDYQGVALKCSMDPEIYVIRDNRIDVIIRLHRASFPDVPAAVRTNVKGLLPRRYGAVIRDLMIPYMTAAEAGRNKPRSMR